MLFGYPVQWGFEYRIWKPNFLMLGFLILSNIFLAGLQVLLSSACVAELRWACGWVLHHVFGVQIFPLHGLNTRLISITV